MKDEIRSEEISPTFSVQVAITDTERKLVFASEGNKETTQLFFKTLRRLSQRMENAESFTAPLYEIESMKEKELTVRVPKEELKRQFDKFCSDRGMTMTTAICVFAKKAVKEQRILFEITADPFYSLANIKRLEKAVADLEKGRGSKHELIEEE